MTDSSKAFSICRSIFAASSLRKQPKNTLLEASWGPWGRSWAFRRLLGAFLVAPGSVLGLTGRLWGAFLDCLGASGGLLGHSRQLLRGFWAPLDGSRGPHGPLRKAPGSPWDATPRRCTKPRKNRVFCCILQGFKASEGLGGFLGLLMASWGGRTRPFERTSSQFT